LSYSCSCVALFVPRIRKTSLKNLALAFPDLNEVERIRIFKESIHSLARLINDCLRLEQLSDSWVREHVDIPYLSTYLSQKKLPNSRPYLFVTGHLGSFDLMAYSIGLLGYPLAFIVRRFKNPYLDRWFTDIRARTGNKVIERSGALRKVLRELHEGNDVGILFDQNVTRKHAIFVDWFGRPAATSFAPALAVLSTGCRVAAVCITHCLDDNYRIEVTEIEVDDVVQDESLNKEDKLRVLTDRFSQTYQQMIRAHPTEWFWFHRRWKTTPSGVDESFY
jgi:KDO2-lipid IV(A) lauroyltransferase